MLGSPDYAWAIGSSLLAFAYFAYGTCWLSRRLGADGRRWHSRVLIGLAAFALLEAAAVAIVLVGFGVWLVLT